MKSNFPDKRRTMLHKLALILVIMFTFPSGIAVAAEPILLVGNSFTGFTYAQISFRQLFRDRWIGGWNLDQHFNDSVTRSAICDDRTFVVLQDFSTRASNNALFQADMDEMIPLVRSCNAEPVLFMTWETRDIGFSAIRSAYEQAGIKHQVQVIPIGTVWNRIRAGNESIYQSFLQTDGKHPTVRGAKVNAASLLRAFCSICYQSFDWTGFSSNEIAFVKGHIEQNISRVSLPPPVEPAPPVEPPQAPEESQKILPAAIIMLLLSEDTPL